MKESTEDILVVSLKLKSSVQFCVICCCRICVNFCVLSERRKIDERSPQLHDEATGEG